MLVALLFVAVLTNAIVLRRIAISFSHAFNPNPLVGENLQAVIFDFDGTIADTMPALTDLAVQLLSDNYDISTGEAHTRYRETTGMDFASQMEMIFPGDPRNREVVETFEARKPQLVLDKPLFPEVVATLKLFTARGIRQFICSSTRAEIVTEYVARQEIDGLFDRCFGYEPSFEKGRQVASILRDWRLDPDRVLFVSDSLRDYEFVKDKGVRFVGIRRMFDEREFRQRGLFSVEDLATLAQQWQSAQHLLEFVEPA